MRLPKNTSGNSAAPTKCRPCKAPVQYLVQLRQGGPPRLVGCARHTCPTLALAPGLGHYRQPYRDPWGGRLAGPGLAGRYYHTPRQVQDACPSAGYCAVNKL